MTADVPSPREQEMALWLWACDEAIAAGRLPPPSPGGSANAPLGREELACLQLLDGLRDRRPAPVTVAIPPDASEPGESDFLAVVRLSGLVDPLPLYEVAHRTAPDPLAKPETLADQLVTDGLLTRYQADRLLAGDRNLLLSGRYRVLDQLGAGGMGEVYLCAHAVMKHKVAVKVLPPERAADPAALERFRQEARAVAALDHPHIVRAYDIDSDGPVHYLVMEYVEGRTLHDVIRADGPLPVRTAAGYVAQVAAALQHAHERGLVHRDVKPGNLIVDAAGTVKVLDLGLARFFQAGGEAADGEDAGLVVGTADYMAPEQSLDGPGADTRADIYSLGCTLYFLLTGRAPFQNKSVSQKLLCHQFRKPEPLRKVRPEVPAGLAAVVDRMTAKDPVDRYQTPAEVVAALRPWVDVPPVPTAASRRWGTWAGLAGGLAASIGGLLVLASYFSDNGLPAFARPAVPAATVNYPTNELAGVMARLQALNPRFDGQLGGLVYHTADNALVAPAVKVVDGRVTHLSFCTDAVTDIGPLAALTTLEHLSLRGSSDKSGRLSDLSPLRGLALKTFDCSSNRGVRDFGPLNGMPLEELTFGAAGVTDLSPLRGMRLRKFFGGSSQIADLAPLRGMPLTAVSVRGTRVDDLEPLRGAPLELLRCEGSRIRDLSPVAGAPLRVFTCKGAPVSSLTPLAGCQLSDLEFDYKPDRDADLPNLLRGVKTINGKPAASFWASVRPDPGD